MQSVKQYLRRAQEQDGGEKFQGGGLNTSSQFETTFVKKGTKNTSSAKQFGQGPPPHFFGQCQKENTIFRGGCP